MLSKIRCWFDSLVNRPKPSKPIYVDLAPTDDADPRGIYTDALFYATQNTNVSNIALTGPYGSGKSSVIRTFLKKYGKGRALKISLAAFLPETDGQIGSNSQQNGYKRAGHVDKHDIERSILQQMLYGADANKLPLSRFKRIQTPKWWSKVLPLLALVGIVACWHVIQNHAEILSGKFFLPLKPSSWFNLVSFTASVAFFWTVFYQLYLKSFGVSLKSISLKNIDFFQGGDSESILNRHLDEIIYFFQSTRYDLVIIEDLDRFDDPDIFVTLREINSLVNQNAGVKRQVRFLYALRDDMFKSTERTKFFEFIIPVIPIINSSNAIDMVIKQGKRLSLDERLDPQFLREVSRYLNDLRLIQNIFNEYAVYVANLDDDEEHTLDANKLLAILIYKNVLPKDFEELHRGRGMLAKVIGRHADYVANAEAIKKSQIAEFETKIAGAEKQVASDIGELRKIYAMAIIEDSPINPVSFQSETGWAQISTLPSDTNFDQIMAGNRIHLRNQNGQGHQVNLIELQKRINSSASFQERKELIELKSSDLRTKYAKEVARLRKEISSIRLQKFNQIILANLSDAQRIFNDFDENEELVKFLILEGFLDDTYYHYTSLFHSGRLSPSDNSFLRLIRSFATPDPDFQIDNPKEVIVAMRDDDFRQSFVLNKTVIDCLLSEPELHEPRISKLIEFVSGYYPESEEFLAVYYNRGKRVSELLSRLVTKWPGFISASLASPNKATHIAHIIAHLPKEDLKKINQSEPKVSNFLASNLADILASGIDIAPERLILIPFKVLELESVRSYPEISKALFENEKYRITKSNISFIFGVIFNNGATDNLEKQNYSTILGYGNKLLLKAIEANFIDYFEHVLLTAEHNTEESVEAIIRVASRDEIDGEKFKEFLQKQYTRLPNLDELPSRHHSAALELRKIEPSWDNCLTYIHSDNFVAGLLTQYLQSDETLNEISKNPINNEKRFLPLRKFLIENDNFDNTAYRSYVRLSPKSFDNFPNDIDWEKLRILVEENKIPFSIENFTFLESDTDLKAEFTGRNISEYFEIEDLLSLDDDFREKLLNKDISDNDRFKIIEQMDLSSLTGHVSRAAIIGQYIQRSGRTLNQLTKESASEVIAHSRPVTTQISLFNKFQTLMDDASIWRTLKRLPKPFTEIELGYDQPTIPNTKENHEFVRWLEDRNIISSWKVTFFDEIRIYNRRK